MNKLAVLMSGYEERQLRRGYVDTSLGQLHYRECGNGTPIVLIHQTPSSSRMWERLMTIFPDEYRLVAFDSPGFGNSDSPKKPLGITGYSAAILEAMSQLDIRRAIVCGHHTGASIGMEIAVTDQDRVRALILLGPFAPATALQLHWWRSLVHRWEPDIQGDFVNDIVLPRLKMVTGASDAQHFLSELIGYLQAGPNYWWAYDSVFAYDALRRAELVTQPSLILVGELEAPDQVDMGRSVGELIPGSEFAIVSGGTSEMVSDVPDQVLEQLLPFLRRLKD